MSYNKQVGTFLRTHKGQNKRALEMILLGIDHMLQHNREWTGVARLVTGVEPRMGKMMLRILGECIGGISKVSDTKQPTGIRFKFSDNSAATESLDKLRELVANGESIYGQAVQELVGMNVKATATFDPEKRFASFAAAVVAADMDEAEALERFKAAYRKAKVSHVESLPVALPADI